MKAQRTIVVFGAGNIGLSFIAQIFFRAGYRVVIADVNRTVLDRIATAGGYEVLHLDPDGTEERFRIEPAALVDATDVAAVKAVLNADPDHPPLVATAVGLRAFPIVLRTIALCVSAERLPAIDIIAAENIHDPRALAAETLVAPAGEHVPPGGHASAGGLAPAGVVADVRLPAVHACSVGKMVPVQTPGTGALVVAAEAYNTLYVDGSDWRGAPPMDVPWIELVEPVEAFMDRKLYVHNLGHAACAYFARRLDPAIATVSEAIANPVLRARVYDVMNSGARVVAATYPGAFSSQLLEEHIQDLLHRFGNRRLGDGVERVGQDLQRKLSKHDRIVGALLAAARCNLPLQPICAVYDAALHFGAVPAALNQTDRAISRRALQAVASGSHAVRAFIGETSDLASEDPHEAAVLAGLTAAVAASS